MSRALILGLLFAGVLMNPSWAQNKNGPDASGPPYPSGAIINFQWDYSCPGGRECSFTCGTGGASHVTSLRIYLGALPLGTDQKNFSLFYDFGTVQVRRGNGFNISTGINTLSCPKLMDSQ